MQTYTLWSEAGGVGKTTLSVNLAAAHARRGYDVLVVDLDPQDAGLTDHVGAGEHKHDGEDNLVRHMIDKPRGPFADLIVETDEGFDLVPSHDTMARLGQLLRRAEEMAEQMDGDDSFDPSKRLFEVLQGYGVQSEYDILLVDCPATGARSRTACPGRP